MVAGISTLTALLLVEFAARWYVEGGALPALGSLIGRPAWAGMELSDSGLATDRQLGFALNPTKPGICSRGYRGEEPVPGRRPGVRRVLVLGDSLSYDADGWPELMRQRLAAETSGGLELINASIPGYTTFQERRLFELRLADLEPDLVVLQYCLNDNHRFLHQLGLDGRRLFTAEARRSMVAGGGRLMEWICRFSYAAVELRERWLLRRLESEARRPWDQLEGFRTAWEDASWVDFEDELALLRESVEAHGGRLVVVAFPLESQLDSEGEDVDEAWVRKPQRSLREVCDRLGVPLLDLFEPFREAVGGAETLFVDGLHLTPAGHALAAAHVTALLMR